MAIRKRKPTSPGRRFQTSSDFSEITKTTPEKSLLAKKGKVPVGMRPFQQLSLQFGDDEEEEEG